MSERERLIRKLENYELYANAMHFTRISVDAKLIIDLLNFLREQPSDDQKEAKQE